MKILRYAPFVLALVIFIISNIIQRVINSDKKAKEDRIAQIEKDLTSYLQYESLSRADFNFAQLGMNAVVESVYNSNEMTTPLYMSTVVQQLQRAFGSLQEATKTVSYNKAGTSDEEIKSTFAEFTSSAESGNTSQFTSSFSTVNQKISMMLGELKSNIDHLGIEKQQKQNELSAISSNEKLVINITLAINFLILLFNHKQVLDKQKT